jgi:hypothetical protein
MRSYSLQSAQERTALSRLRQILGEPGLLRASWVKMKHPCGRPSCRCAKAKRHWHLSWYVSQSQKGRPRMKCVPQEQLEEVRRWVSRYQEARSLLARIGDLYWSRIGQNPKSK